MNNSATLVAWLRSMVQAMPHGGKKTAAEKLGLSASGLSKLLGNPDRGFDEKTLRAQSWCENSKASRWPEAKYPILNRSAIGPLIIEERRALDGASFFVWKVNPEAMKS